MGQVAEWRQKGGHSRQCGQPVTRSGHLCMGVVSFTDAHMRFRSVIFDG